MRMPAAAVILGVVCLAVLASPAASQAASPSTDLCLTLLGRGATCQTPEMTLTNPQGLTATLAPVTYTIAAAKGSPPSATTSYSTKFNLTGASSCTFYLVVQMQCQPDGTSTLTHNTSVTPKSRTGSTACGSKTGSGYYNISQGPSQDVLVLQDDERKEGPTMCTLSKAGARSPPPPVSVSPPPSPSGSSSGSGGGTSGSGSGGDTSGSGSGILEPPAADLCLTLLEQGATCRTPEMTLTNFQGLNATLAPVTYTIPAAPGGTVTSTTTSFTTKFNVTATSSCTFYSAVQYKCRSDGTSTLNHNTSVTATARTGTAICGSRTGSGYYNISQGPSQGVLVLRDDERKEEPTTCTLGKAGTTRSTSPAPSPPALDSSGSSSSGTRGNSSGSGIGVSSNSSSATGSGSNSGNSNTSKAVSRAAMSSSGMGPVAEFLLAAAVVCGLQMFV